MEATALAERAATLVRGSMISRLSAIHIGPMPLPLFAATALVAGLAIAAGRDCPTTSSAACCG